ncbi:WG repeat-containing protein, partial [Paenibacillus wulumuqiensis]|uniref:WG repeat-containing protein n=1 Tax=Paenibacillus wulumuqiensis TaxID=1567107 RepID=UPI00061974AF
MSVHLYRLKQNNKYGFLNKEGEFLIPPIYLQAEDFSEELAAVTMENGYKGYINKENKVVFQIEADRLGKFNKEWATFIVSRKTGIINRQGEIIVPPIFEQIMLNNNKTFVGQQNGKMRLYDEKTNAILALEFDYLGRWKNGEMVARKQGKQGLISDKGDEIIPFEFAYCGSFEEGYAQASLDNDKYGFIDKTGEFVIPPTYYQLFDFSEDLAAFRLKTAGKWGFINPDNEVVIKPKFQSVSNFSEGISAVELKDSYGYIDRQGKWIVKN